MIDVLTNAALAGAAVLFAAWFVLANRGRIARAADRLVRIPRPRLAAFLFFAAVATLSAQKGGTNANAALRTLNSQLPQFTFRLESVATNGSCSYAMPANGVRYENWWLRGAWDIVELCDYGIAEMGKWGFSHRFKRIGRLSQESKFRNV